MSTGQRWGEPSAGSGTRSTGLRASQVVGTNPEPGGSSPGATAAAGDVARSVSEKRSGDVVPVVLVRDGRTITLDLPLLPEVRHKDTTPSASYATWRQDDFPTALEYSPPVATTECGGPLVDLSGRVVGVTVGSAAKHAGWAIPAEAVRRVVDDAKRGKLAPWPTR